MTSILRCCVSYATILIIISASIEAYNFDVDNVIVYEDVRQSEGSRESYSGFSVALWNPGGAGLEKSWIFIGAPRANSTNISDEPGAIFKCKIGEKCQEWVMDHNDSKGPGHGSWLGGSMGILDGRNASIVVCAPRWLNKTEVIAEARPAWPMEGICYRASMEHLSELKTTKRIPIHPLETALKREISYYVMAECGFSTHIVPGPNPSIIFGCPGVHKAHGIPIQYNINGKNSITPDATTAQKYDYSGYAVTSGYYTGRKNQRWYAMSAPRSSDLLGKVSTFTFLTDSQKIKIENYILGDQAGEYFGYALASCDIDGDGFDELLVGAPQWTKIVDEGQVYIYDANRDLKKSMILKGTKPRGRFGSAITCLGDIDHDGYQDVAIGAPYDGKGVVYIYHGSEEGLIHTQTIVSPVETKGFGSSISEPRDIDNNNHADIAVGAYLSGHVTLFRSKRVVTTSVTLSIVSDSSERNLQRNASSFLLKICSSYEGKHAPPTLDVIKELKVDEIHQRAEVEAEGNRQTTYKFKDTLELKSPSCKNFTIRLKKITNFLQPLKLSVIQRLPTTHIGKGTLLIGRHNVTGTDYFQNSSTVMKALANHYLDVAFAVECGSVGCNSNLSIKMMTDLKSGDPHVIGSKGYIELYINVTNTKDQAYLTQAIVKIPIIIQLHHIPSTCGSERMGEYMQVTCEIGNPLGTDATARVNFSLDMSPVPSDTRDIEIIATATTQSTDAASGNHNDKLVISCVAQTDIGIIRKATIDGYPYTVMGKDEELQNIAFQHIYEIKNYEITPIEQALLSVSIPTHWIHAGNEIEIVRLNRTTGYLAGREFDCVAAGTYEDITSVGDDPTTKTEWWTRNSNSSMRNDKFTIIDERVYAASPDNRTLHINCTNPSVKWTTIDCKLRFEGIQSVAKLALTFDLLLANFSSNIIQDKDIIFFVTNSSVKISGHPGETINNEPNLIMIGTMFIGSPPENRVPVWIIALSVLVGLLLLILVIIGLLKFGFFKRNKQMELRALLKEKNEPTPGTAAEPAS